MYLQIIIALSVVSAVFVLILLSNIQKDFLSNLLNQKLSALHRSKRIKNFSDQMIDVLSLITNSLRSGLSLPQAIMLVSNEMDYPANDEFKRIIADMNIGTTLEEALDKSFSRLPIDDWGVTIDTIKILKKTGGNMAETFSLISQTIQERQRVRGKIKVLMAQGVFQAVIILAMGPAMLIGLQIISPDFIAPMFSTMLGRMMLIFALILQIIGAMLIKKIITIRI